MNIVTIKEVKGVVICADDGTAEHVFNVKNSTDKARRVGIHLATSEQVRNEWLAIDGPTELDLDVDTLTQVSVKSKVPKDCAPGKYSYRLRVFDPENPGEDYTDGDSVFFEVPKRKEEVPEHKENGKKKSRWWIPVTVGAVIILAVVVWFLIPSGVSLPDFTRSDWDWAKVKAFCDEKNIECEPTFKESGNSASRGKILRQDPGPDTKLKDGDKVKLDVAGVKVARFKDRLLSDVILQLDSLGLAFETEKDLTVKPVMDTNLHGKVQDQDPEPNQIVAPKTHIKLIVGQFRAKKIPLPFGRFIDPRGRATNVQ